MKMMRDTRWFPRWKRMENPITENDNTLQNISSGVVVIRCNEARITRLFSSTMLVREFFKILEKLDRLVRKIEIGIFQL